MNQIPHTPIKANQKPCQMALLTFQKYENKINEYYFLSVTKFIYVFKYFTSRKTGKRLSSVYLLFIYIYNIYNNLHCTFQQCILVCEFFAQSNSIPRSLDSSVAKVCKHVVTVLGNPCIYVCLFLSVCPCYVC